MKSIINGKRYDTEKAIKIGKASSNEGRRDFRWFDEALYKTPRSGVFFIAGEGGPMSRYARSAGQNSWQGSEAIIPISKDEAMEWAERHMTTEDIEKHFGDEVTDA